MKNICLFVLALLCLQSSFAQNYTTSAGSATTGSSSGLCLAGTFTNKDNTTSPTLKDYAHFSLGLGVGCSYWLDATLNGTSAAGTYAGFHLRSSSLLSLLSGIKVETYLNGVFRESAGSGALLNVISSGEGDVYFLTTKTYNETRIVMGGLASVAYDVDIYYGFGMPTVPTGVALPLSFTQFRAGRTDGSVALSWEISSDESIRSMEVERSTDGRNFITIGNPVAGSDTHFSFVDKSDADAWYRIHVSTANRSYYSRILHVMEKTGGINITYNNPVSDRLTIGLSAAAGSRFQLELTALDGRLVYRRDLNLTTQGSTITLDRGGLQPGLYLLRVSGSDGKSTVKKIFFN